MNWRQKIFTRDGSIVKLNGSIVKIFQHRHVIKVLSFFFEPRIVILLLLHGSLAFPFRNTGSAFSHDPIASK